jgi:Alpha/beta hydrolase domain
VRLPELQAPLATYTGWNLRDPGIGAADLRTSFLGSFLPFARNAAEREKSGDPRASVAERYNSREQYMGKFAEVAKKLIQDRFLLQEDLSAMLERGQREWNEVAGER